MNVGVRHIRWYFVMVVALLCLVVSHNGVAAVDCAPEDAVEISASVLEESDDACASLSEKKDDMSRAAREMGQWGIPSASVTLQGTLGRTLMCNNVLQRMCRTMGTVLTCAPLYTDSVAEALRHALSTKRFYAGYYIYYRCQMRC